MTEASNVAQIDETSVGNDQACDSPTLPDLVAEGERAVVCNDDGSVGKAEALEGGKTNIVNAAPIVEADQFMELIKRAAENPEFDISKVQALIDMRNIEIVRIEDARLKEIERVARKKYFEAYVPMSTELPMIARKKYNKHTQSYYAAHEDINEKIKPVLEKHGFALKCDIKQTKEDVTVYAILRHKDGFEESVSIILPLDVCGAKGGATKTPLQGIASSIKYGKRIAMSAILNLSTGDDDDKDGNKPIPDGENPPLAIDLQLISDDQLKELESLIYEAGCEKISFVQRLKLDSLNMLPKTAYTKAANLLKARIYENQKKNLNKQPEGEA